MGQGVLKNLYHSIVLPPHSIKALNVRSRPVGWAENAKFWNLAMQNFLVIPGGIPMKVHFLCFGLSLITMCLAASKVLLSKLYL